MGIKTFIQSLARKISGSTPIILRAYSGNSTIGVWTKRNLAQYSDDGYRRCLVAYRSINLVAKGLANIPIEVRINGKSTKGKHPVDALLKKPNPWQGGDAFLESVAAYYLITGNTYIEGVGPDGKPPIELYALRPDRMRVLPGTFGIGGYRYEVNGDKKDWAADPITGKSAILHMKTFNPLDDFYGMSPIEAAASAVDQFNFAGEWNQSLLQNSARPSGAVVYSNEASGQLSDEQYARIKEEVNGAYSGTRNAGRVMILEGGMDWKQMQFSPADMDWINGKNASAREIAQAFGVAPQLLGIPGDNTYSNYQEGRQALYEDTIIPLLNSFLANLSGWLSGPYPGIELVADTKALPALAPKRKDIFTMVQSATFMTINEKREACNLAPLEQPEANEVLIPAGLVPLTGSMDEPDGDESADGVEAPDDGDGQDDESGTEDATDDQ